MCYVNGACDSCDTVGQCIVIDGEFDDKTILCADCTRIREELETEFGQDDEMYMGDDAEDFEDAEYDYDSAEDDGDMYGDDLTFADERDFDMSDEF